MLIIALTISSGIHKQTTYNHNLPRFKNLTGKSTHLALKNSATFFPRKSTVVVLETPRSNKFRNKKCTALKFGSSKRSIASSALELYSGPRSSAIFSVESSDRSQAYSSLRRTQNPQFASGPLSPERAWMSQPNGPGVVGPKSGWGMGAVVRACEGWRGGYVVVFGGAGMSRTLLSLKGRWTRCLMSSWERRVT